MSKEQLSFQYLSPVVDRTISYKSAEQSHEDFFNCRSPEPCSMFTLASKLQAENFSGDELEVVSFRITDSPLTFRNSPAAVSLSATTDSRGKFEGSCPKKSVQGGFFRNSRKENSFSYLDKLHPMFTSLHGIDNFMVPSNPNNQQIGSKKLRKKAIQKSKRVLKRTGVANKQKRLEDQEAGSQICFRSKLTVARPTGTPSLAFTMHQLNPAIF